MVEREKARSEIEQPDADCFSRPWYSDRRPRLTIESIDFETVAVIDFCLREIVYGISHELMGGPCTALTVFVVLCSGLIDYGSTGLTPRCEFIRPSATGRHAG